jgi:hypothetical protein
MRVQKVALLFVGSWIAVINEASAISIANFATPYTQNFDTLANTGTSSTVPAGWAFSESGTGANTTYTAGTGSSTTGDTYSFGSTGSGERALGGLQSGSLVSSFGASFDNNTGGAIGALLISYTGEQWRLGATGREDRLDFQYSTDATSLTSGIWTDVNPLDFLAPTTAGATGALDGNAAANRSAISSSINGLSIPNGATFWIRWLDANASGSDDGQAVDDIMLLASPATQTSSVPDGLPLPCVALGFFAVVGLSRLRSCRLHSSENPID